MIWLEQAFETYIYLVMIVTPILIGGLVFTLLAAGLNKIYMIFIEWRERKRGYYVEWVDKYYQEDKYYY